MGDMVDHTAQSDRDRGSRVSAVTYPGYPVTQKPAHTPTATERHTPLTRSPQNHRLRNALHTPRRSGAAPAPSPYFMPGLAQPSRPTHRPFLPSAVPPSACVRVQRSFSSRAESRVALPAHVHVHGHGSMSFPCPGPCAVYTSHVQPTCMPTCFHVRF